MPEFRVIPNMLDRYNLNSHSPLEHEPGGGLRLDISPEPIRGRPQSNWLPSPADGIFSLTLRLYVPTETPLAGEWFPPPLTPVEEQGPNTSGLYATRLRTSVCRVCSA